MDQVDSGQLLIFIITFPLVGIVFWALSSNSRMKQLHRKLKGLQNFNSTQKFFSVRGDTAIAIDETKKKICLMTNKQLANAPTEKQIFIIGYRDILSSELLQDGASVTTTSRTSQVGNALLGGLLFGGVGAVVGALTSKTETRGKTKSVDLKVTINDTACPVWVIGFLGFETKQGSLLHKQAMEKASHLQGLLTALMKQADIEDNKNIKPISIADELSKLAVLRKEGILSEDEFHQQKRKLLS